MLVHALLNKETKTSLYEDFKCNKINKIQIMVVTSVFGMGMNFTSVREVICYSLPFSIAEDIQKIGREGRDKESCVAVQIYKETTDLVDNMFTTNDLMYEHDNSSSMRYEI